MEHGYTGWDIAVKIWLGTSGVLGVGTFIGLLIFEPGFFWISILLFIASLIASAPVLFALNILAGWFQSFNASEWCKIRLLLFSCLGIELVYGVLGAIMNSGFDSFRNAERLLETSGTITVFFSVVHWYRSVYPIKHFFPISLILNQIKWKRQMRRKRNQTKH